ncbi:MAG: hypothetical protein ACR2HQ_14005 [Ilumatobacteraceae bacterium]
MIGVERFVTAGLTPDELRVRPEPEVAELGLDEAAATEMFEAFGGCEIDITERVIQALSPGRDLPAEDIDCLRDSLDESLVRDLVVTSFVEGDRPSSGARTWSPAWSRRSRPAPARSTAEDC